MKDQIVIRSMKKSDDTKKVARLVYDTSKDLFSALFGKMNKALSKIEILINLEDNIFSYRHISIVLVNEDIAGVLVGYHVNQISKEKMKREMKAALSFWSQLRCMIILSNSHHIMDFDDIDGYYIQNICVDPQRRGKKLGYRLLEHCITMNNEMGNKEVFLDVESTNDIAINLYKKLGFELFRTTKIKLAGITLYRMKKLIH